MEISYFALFVMRSIAALLLSAASTAYLLQLLRCVKLPAVQVSGIFSSSLMLNCMLQLPGRSLSGMDGLIVALNLVTIVILLAGQNFILRRADRAGRAR